MPRLRGLLLALVVGSAVAQPSSVDPFAAIILPCTGAPPDAVLSIPAPADRWAQLICTRYGHMAVAAQDVHWTFYGSDQALFLPAQDAKETVVELGHQAYFVAIDAWRTDFEESSRIRDQYAKFFEPLADASEPAVFKLRLTNQDGMRHTLYILDWHSHAAGLLCSDECLKYIPFAVTATDSADAD